MLNNDWLLYAARDHTFSVTLQPLRKRYANFTKLLNE